MPDPYIPDQTYTFDGVNYWAGKPMPRDVARTHGLVDAESPGESASTEQEGVSLPDHFPSGSRLREDGYETVEGVDAATDEELLSVRMIGEATVKEIRAAVDEILEA